MNVAEIIINFYPAWLGGLWVTLKLSLIIWISGLLGGGALGILGNKYRLTLGLPSRFMSFLLGGVPLLVFLFWLHYPAQAVMNVVIDPFYTAALALSVINIFMVADIIRGALHDFPQQYITAAKVTGLSKSQLIFKIQIPLILRQILPGLLMLQVTMLHTTLFASLISVDEIFRIAQRVNAQIYRPVEIYTALGVFFLAISLPINGLAFWLRWRFTRNLSEQ